MILNIIFLLAGLLFGSAISLLIAHKCKKYDGTLIIDETRPDDVKMRLEFDTSMDDMVNKRYLYIEVNRLQIERGHTR